MKIQFIGAARTVTGSQHLLTINNKKILLECGLFQGRRKDTYEKNKNFSFDPKEIDTLILSHAHIDHSGNIPHLVKDGFRGPIYSTSATKDLCEIMLKDSAYLQQRDIEWLNKKNKKHIPDESLYSIEDVDAAIQYFVPVNYNTATEIFPGVTAYFQDAGHILGSAGIFLEIEEENGKKINFGFSGDIGRYDTPIIKDPDYFRDLDLLIMESTYGNRLHTKKDEVEEEVAKVVRQVFDRKGKIIIPAFAVGRTQLLVYVFHKLFDQKRIPEIPIYVDSPLAVNATKVFKDHPECFDRETSRIFLESGNDPFGFGRLKYISTVDQSKELNDINDPIIIISASGMAEGGRILHHLANNIGNPKNLVLFVGYAAEQTLARKIMDGIKQVNILGEEYSVNCQIKIMDYFSGHADQNELLDYLSLNPQKRLKNIFLVHGEEDQALPLKEKILQKGYKNADYPMSGEKFVI
ncbi:MAG: MBL fold metallo-hydrolase [Ignavibacteriota bacterium]|nr:MAG: MBL fold metallo-hydrolase [Chlorobiota bacterium]MBL1123042.1 MBL fold metallo-hydrolase [Ignavibacteriota bacterium]MCC7094189.1 MBL fold metallo-hydrolase [Ignavibacteriaceae bacterium]MCE7855744.1 MBL fold metallo-hydrolase [Ignavibacteria bacterium CHB3]MEB2295083.1 MBL fold metallo-hydrolase [Ignavibacteria bacterium]